MTGPIRIAIASSGLGHVARGIEAWADDLATALAARGQDVLLCKGAGTPDRPFERIVPCWTRERRGTLRLLRCLPRSFAWRVGLGSGYGVEQTTFALNLVRLLRQERADLLHVQDPQVAIIAQRARRLGLVRTRTILAHGTEETAEFLRRIHYLQHLAPWHLEQVRAAGVWKPAWTSIPNFIDTDRFAPGRSDGLRAELGIPAGAQVVLTVAAIKREHKRIGQVLAEFARMRQTTPELPAWLVVAGGWEQDTEELVAEGRRLLGDRVRFLVRFPRARMPELYRAADVFALGSLFEMMPIALIEAAASGLPCVVNWHPVMEWMTGPGGSRIDMEKPGALAAELRRLLADLAGRADQGMAARSHSVANFSRDAVVDQILEYYRRVMSPRPKAVGV